MQKKYGDRELAVLTVTVDDPRDAAVRKKVETYLGGLKPPFRTVNLAGYDVDRMPTLYFGGGVPGVFVFNRDNRYVLKLPLYRGETEVTKYSPEAIDKAVAEAIKK